MGPHQFLAGDRAYRAATGLFPTPSDSQSSNIAFPQAPLLDSWQQHDLLEELVLNRARLGQEQLNLSAPQARTGQSRAIKAAQVSVDFLGRIIARLESAIETETKNRDAEIKRRGRHLTALQNTDVPTQASHHGLPPRPVHHMIGTTSSRIEELDACGTTVLQHDNWSRWRSPSPASTSSDLIDLRSPERTVFVPKPQKSSVVRWQSPNSRSGSYRGEVRKNGPSIQKRHQTKAWRKRSYSHKTQWWKVDRWRPFWSNPEYWRRLRGHRYPGPNMGYDISMVHTMYPDHCKPYRRPMYHDGYRPSDQRRTWVNSDWRKY